MDEIFKTADFVSLHTPLSKETIGLIDQDFISKFENPFVLINTARGRSVVLKDLLEALKIGKISGACLDVLELESSSFENVSLMEDPVFKELSELDNIIFSPHIAGWTIESKLKMAQFLLDKIRINFQRNT